MKKEKFLMSFLCIMCFIIYSIVDPPRFVTLAWIFIAFINTHTNYE